MRLTDLQDSRLQPFAHTHDWQHLTTLLVDEEWAWCGSVAAPGAVSPYGAALELEDPADLSAKQRRALHRAGFRPDADWPTQRWLWSVPDDQLAARCLAATGVTARVSDRLRRHLVERQMIAECAVAVLRDVLRHRVEDVLVLGVPECDHPCGCTP